MNYHDNVWISCSRPFKDLINLNALVILNTLNTLNTLFFIYKM